MLTNLICFQETNIIHFIRLDGLRLILKQYKLLVTPLLLIMKESLSVVTLYLPSIYISSKNENN